VSKLYEAAQKLRQVGRLQIGRLFGTVMPYEGRYKAAIDLLERCYFMRGELNALAGILISKGVMTANEWEARQTAEFEHYLAALAKDWPEVTFEAEGFTIRDMKALEQRMRDERWPR
jgi:hypothetical protein